MRFFRLMYSPRLMDASFVFLGLLCAGLLVFRSGMGAPAIAAVDQPVLKGLSLLAVAAVASVLAAGTARLDRRKADDFVYACLIKSGYIGMLATVAFLLFWSVFFMESFGDIPSFGVVLVTGVCWTIGYAITRVTGTSA